MKKILAILFAVCVLHMQNHAQSKFNIEVRLSAHAAGLYNADAPHPYFVSVAGILLPASTAPEDLLFYHEYDHKLLNGLRFNVLPGIIVNYRHNNKVEFFSGLSIKGKGIMYKDKSTRTTLSGQLMTFDSSSIERRVKNSYVELPLGIKYYLGGKKINMFIYGGVYTALLIGETARFDAYKKRTTEDLQNGGTNVQLSTMRQNDGGSEFSGTKTFDFGLIAGFGGDYPINKKLAFTASLGLQAGLTKLDKHNNNEYSLEPLPMSMNRLTSRNYYGFSSDAKNFQIELNVGLRVNLKK